MTTTTQRSTDGTLTDPAIDNIYSPISLVENKYKYKYKCSTSHRTIQRTMTMYGELNDNAYRPTHAQNGPVANLQSTARKAKTEINTHTKIKTKTAKIIVRTAVRI